MVRVQPWRPFKESMTQVKTIEELIKELEEKSNRISSDIHILKQYKSLIDGEIATLKDELKDYALVVQLETAQA